MALTKITSSVIGSNVIGSSQIANAAIESRHLAGSNIFSNISVNSANVGSFYSWFDSNANAYGYTANSKFSITNYFVNDIELFKYGVYSRTVLTRPENVFSIESTAGGPGLLISSNSISIGRTTSNILPTSNTYILNVRGGIFAGADVLLASNLDILNLSASPNAVANVATANNWYFANDYNTYLQIAANDYNTYLAAQANDGVTLATARGNDHSTLLSARANDLTTWNSAQGNDHSTLLSARANDLATWNSAQGNDHSTLLSARANDLATWNSAQGNDHSTLLTARSNDYNTYNAIINDSTVKFTSNKTFARDLVIEGNLFILGDSVTANVSNISTEDKTIIINWNSTDALAEGSGIQVAGTSSALLANLIYASASVSKFRVGVGTLTSADDIARTRDYQANDWSTYSTLAANDGATLLTARSNDWNTYSTLAANDGATLLSARQNDHVTYLAALANDGATLLTARQNDHVTYLAALANDGATLLTARQNDHVTYLAALANDGATLLSARGNDYTTYLAALANDFNTYTSLNANLNSVQSNVNAKVSKAGDTMTGELTLSGPPTSASNAATKAYVDGALGLSLQPRYNTNVSSGTSNCFFVRVSANSPASLSYVYSSLNGIDQVNGVDFVYNIANDTIQYTDSSVPAGLRVLIRAFTN
jgi:hypothetical protein